MGMREGIAGQANLSEPIDIRRRVQFLSTLRPGSSGRHKTLATIEPSASVVNAGQMIKRGGQETAPDYAIE